MSLVGLQVVYERTCPRAPLACPAVFVYALFVLASRTTSFFLSFFNNSCSWSISRACSLFIHLLTSYTLSIFLSSFLSCSVGRGCVCAFACLCPLKPNLRTTALLFSFFFLQQTNKNTTCSSCNTVKKSQVDNRAVGL